MSARFHWLSYLIMIMAIISGCTFDVGNKTVGVRSGQFIFIDGNLKTDYRFSFDKVWAACEKALADMKATDMDKTRKIASGTITALIGDEKVTILVDYMGKEQTLVSVMVGPVGNNLASRLIHEKITGNLLNAPQAK
jgi:hypothetical protein